MFKRQTKKDIVFDIVNYTIIIIATLLVLYPLYFVVISSISDPAMVNGGMIYLHPKGVNIDGYKLVFKSNDILIGYRNTVFYTVVGTFINLILTIMAAYPLSKKDLFGGKVILTFIIITMYFSGGMIPTYIVLDALGITNTIWAILLLGAINSFNMIILKTFFQSLPTSLEEAAHISGANSLQTLWLIILPLSKPALGVIALYYAVAHWNNYMTPLVYINNRSLYPLQLFLREILIQNVASEEMLLDIENLGHRQAMAESIKYAIIIVASLPLLIAYPFIQKYFVKGVMIGAIKG